MKKMLVLVMNVVLVFTSISQSLNETHFFNAEDARYDDHFGSEIEVANGYAFVESVWNDTDENDQNYKDKDAALGIVCKSVNRSQQSGANDKSSDQRKSKSDNCQ